MSANRLLRSFCMNIYLAVYDHRKLNFAINCIDTAVKELTLLCEENRGKGRKICRCTAADRRKKQGIVKGDPGFYHQVAQRNYP